jgi:transposase
MATHYIGFDVHCEFTEMAVVTSSGKLVQRHRCKTDIVHLRKALDLVAGPKQLTFEEGPMAGWLHRNLASRVNKLVVCNPRRNHLIAKDSDKDDPIDAEKLAQLFRGGYLKQVHQPDNLGRAFFKQHVGLYHDHVRQRVREANVIMAQFRRHGVFVRESEFLDPDERPALRKRLPKLSMLWDNLELLFEGYDLAWKHQQTMRKRLEALARKEEPVRRFVEVPGFAWIRAATFYAYVDTPWRFKSKSALWRYLGIGLERAHSGNGPTIMRVSQGSNRVLRGIMIGAAKTVIDATVPSDPFHQQYQHWMEDGLSTRNARRNVARSLAATLWGMWKNGNAYRPEWVARGARKDERLVSSK